MSLPPPTPQAEDVFLAAYDLPADARPTFLTNECGGDAALRREVEALLAAAPRPAE